jgi:hypothetical protein
MTNATLVTKAEVIAQLQRRLDGQLSEAQLAEWAFARFYAVELGNEALETYGAQAIAAVLDDLMFATDDPSFALDDEALRGLIARLEQV